MTFELISCLSSFNLFRVNAFHSIIFFETLAIPWLFARLACVNVDEVMRNYICSGKRNFHVLVLADTISQN